MAWIGNDQEAIWPQIERALVGGIPLSILRFIDTKSVNKIKIKEEWIRHILKVWTTVKKKMLMGPESILRAMLIVGNIEFPPSVWDGGFR